MKYQIIRSYITDDPILKCVPSYVLVNQEIGKGHKLVLPKLRKEFMKKRFAYAEGKI